MNPKQVVAQGYDQIAARYAEWARSVRKEERAKYTAILIDKLPVGAQVLELGCGSGIPTTQQLVQHFSVTGVDISANQIFLARQNVPTAKLLVADMTQLSFQLASFDAVAAFYSIIHVPRQEHFPLLQGIAAWLRPAGLLVLAMGTRSVETGLEENWLGVPMYWSSFDSATNRALVEKAGFHILSAKDEIAEEFGEPIKFLWIAAQKPT